MALLQAQISEMAVHVVTLVETEDSSEGVLGYFSTANLIQRYWPSAKLLEEEKESVITGFLALTLCPLELDIS